MRPEHFDKPIAVRRTAEVCRWSDGWVVKLYHRPWAGSAEREASIGRVVHAAGLPVPAVGDVVSVEGRTGVVYEHVRVPERSS